MKIMIIKDDMNFVNVIARNQKICKKEMKIFKNFKYVGIVENANHIDGDLGIYRYEICEK